MKQTTALARRIVKSFAEQGKTLSSAESCTGGLIAKLITDISGSSAVFSGACVTYTNDCKQELLGISAELLAAHTEVSEACARAMAEGVRTRLGTTVGVSTTGFAGPTGGTQADPVGTVYIAVSTPAGTLCERFQAPPHATRSQVRSLAAHRALELVIGEK